MSAAHISHIYVLGMDNSIIPMEKKHFKNFNSTSQDSVDLINEVLSKF